MQSECRLLPDQNNNKRLQQEFLGAAAEVESVIFSVLHVLSQSPRLKKKWLRQAALLCHQFPFYFSSSG